MGRQLAVLLLWGWLIVPACSQPSPRSDRERIAGLEEWRQQQREYNHQADTHMIQQTDNLLRDQGDIRGKIDDLYSKIAEQNSNLHTVFVVAGLLGAICASGFGIGVPILVGALNRRSDSLAEFEKDSREQRTNHEARIEQIESSCIRCPVNVNFNAYREAKSPGSPEGRQRALEKGAHR